MSYIGRLLLCLCFAVTAQAQYGYDTIRVYFPINVSNLDPAAKRTLDSVVRIAGAGKHMLIYGYADYLGQEPANNVLASNRAQSVRNYLSTHKIGNKRILVCAGIGEVRRNVVTSADGYPEDRRVAIFLQKTSPGPGPKPKTGGMKVTELGPGAPGTHQAPAKQDVLKPAIKIADAPAAPPIGKFEDLAQMEVNDVMRIESIHFLPTRHFITKDSEPILDALYLTLLHHPSLRIRIEGHVCCIKVDGDALDTDTYEYNLSESRARFIYDFLVEKGIKADRLEYAGFGKRKPIIAIEQSEEDAQTNRRVEFRVLAN